LAPERPNALGSLDRPGVLRKSAQTCDSRLTARVYFHKREIKLSKAGFVYDSTKQTGTLGARRGDF